MKTTHSPTQIRHASEWIADWYNTNLRTLKSTGIQAMNIWTAYAKTTPFPMGVKSFFHMLNGINISGGTIERITKNGANWYVVMM